MMVKKIKEVMNKKVVKITNDKTVLDAAWSAVRKKAPQEGKILQKMLMK